MRRPSSSGPPRRAMAFVIASLLVTGVGVEPASAGTERYSQPTSMVRASRELDVLIVPPHHGQLLNGHSGTRLLNGGDLAELNPLANSYIKALTRAIVDWRKAIATYGSRSLRKLKLRVYVLGRDRPPMAALREPEIVVGWDETKGPVLGISVYNTEGDGPCVILNSMLALNSFSYADMYNTAGHEFGHCLGLSHAEGGRGITRDLMYAVYGEEIGLEDNAPLCMSNLNVKALELVYDGKPSPNVVRMDPRSYRQIRCGQGR